MQRLLILLLLVATATASAAMTFVILDDAPPAADPDILTRISMTRPLPGALGWSDPTPLGRRIQGARATLRLPLQASSPRDLTLLVGLQIQSPNATAPAIDVRLDGVAIGRLAPDQRDGAQRVAITIPAKSAYRFVPATLEFIPRSVGSRRVTFAWVAAHNLQHVPGLRGFVDSCSRRGARGWAADRFGAANVTVRVDDEPWPVDIRQIVRNDLKRVQVTSQAGFDARFKEAAPIGAIVRVVVNGRDLPGSPCKLLR